MYIYFATSKQQPNSALPFNNWISHGKDSRMTRARRRHRTRFRPHCFTLCVVPLLCEYLDLVLPHDSHTFAVCHASASNRLLIRHETRARSQSLYVGFPNWKSPFARWEHNHTASCTFDRRHWYSLSLYLFYCVSFRTFYNSWRCGELTKPTRQT